jgi:hypothetical protein
MRTLLITLSLTAVPRLALACPVCFGQNDSPLAKGANMGIFFMLGVVGVMLTGFAAFFVYLSRRARAFETGTAAPARRTPSAPTPRERMLGRFVDSRAGNPASEGTASC